MYEHIYIYIVCMCFQLARPKSYLATPKNAQFAQAGVQFQWR